VLAHGWQTVPKRGEVRSREPFNFLGGGALIISLERLIVSGVVNLGKRSVW